MRSLTHGGLRRTYRLYIPPAGDDASCALPLLVAFHGRLGTSRHMESLTGFNRIAAREGAVVAYPDGVDRSWNAGLGTGPAEKRGVDDVGFTSALIDEVAHSAPVDLARVYVAGMSNGAAFVNRLGWELSDRIAAIAPVAGTMGAGIASSNESGRAVGVIVFHGRRDHFMPYDGGVNPSGAHIISIPELVASWVERNRCDRTPHHRSASDGIEHAVYGGRACRAGLEHYEIANGGHVWPGGHDRPAKRALNESLPKPDATALMWRFFMAHQRGPDGALTRPG